MSWTRLRQLWPKPEMGTAFVLHPKILAFQAVEAFKVACDMSGLETLLEKTVIDEVKDKIKLESQQ